MTKIFNRLSRFFTQVFVSASLSKHLLLHPLHNAYLSVVLFVYELKDSTRVKLDIFLNSRGIFLSIMYVYPYRERWWDSYLEQFSYADFKDRL